MISLIPYTFDRRLSGAFIDFLYDLYRDDARWIPPGRSALELRFDERFPFYRRTGNAHRHVIATDDGTVVGHVSAIANRDLRDRDGAPVGAVGQFECIDDRAVAADLLRAAVDWLAESGPFARIWAPIDFDIWRGYRFMTRGFSRDPFPGEPYNKPYYPGLFEAFGFSVRHRWTSVELIGRDAMESFIEPLETRYRQCLAAGFRFRPVDFRQPSELEILHAVMVRCIGDFLGYTPFRFDDLREMAMSREGSLDPRLISLGLDERGAAVAFALCYPGRSPASSGQGPTAIFYLIGVVPDRREAGLGGAATYHAVRDMIVAGYQNLTIALIAEDSPGRVFLGGRTEQATKEYALYELGS